MKSKSAEQWTRSFILSASLILALTGLAKVASALGKAQILGVADPVFGIPFRYLMLGVGILELVVSAVGLFPMKERLSLCLITWISVSFGIYRFGLWIMGWHRPCGCLGTLTDYLHISPHTGDAAMRGLLGYLLLGSLLCLWRCAPKWESKSA